MRGMGWEGEFERGPLSEGASEGFCRGEVFYAGGPTLQEPRRGSV